MNLGLPTTSTDFSLLKGMKLSDCLSGGDPPPFQDGASIAELR